MRSIYLRFEVNQGKQGFRPEESESSVKQRRLAHQMERIPDSAMPCTVDA